MHGHQGRPARRWWRTTREPVRTAWYAGLTGKRVNVLVATELPAGRGVRHWLRPTPRLELHGQEHALIRRWRLREVGWNRG